MILIAAADVEGATCIGEGGGQAMDFPCGEVVGGKPGRGASSPPSRRCQKAEGVTTGLAFLWRDEACKRRDAGVRDELGSLLGAAQAIAESSSIPFVPEIAKFLAVLANLSSDLEDNMENMPKTVRWCGSMLNILHGSSLDTVVSKVGSCVHILVWVVLTGRVGSTNRSLTRTASK